MLAMWVGLGGCGLFADGAPAPTPEPYTVSLPPYMAPMPVPEDNPLTVEGVELGRHLFYDPLLSADLEVSCSSCHLQRHAFADPRRVSVGVYGRVGTRNAPALFNLAWNDSFFWDGRAPTLEEQVLMPLVDPLEMDRDVAELVGDLAAHERYPAMFEAAFPGAPLDADHVAKALAQFLRSIVSFRSRWDVWGDGRNPEYASEAERRGHDAFTSLIPSNGDNVVLPCNECHSGEQGLREGWEAHIGGVFAMTGFRNNGLPDDPEDPGRLRVTGDERDRGSFKPPPTRNLALTAPYMHDGRFGTLEEVIRHYARHVTDHDRTDPSLRPGGKAMRLELDDRTIQDLVAFFDMFTDHELTTDPAWSSPFAEDGTLQ